MTLQLPFIQADAKQSIVNVASVPQRSPFRYPGGKTWLIPKIRQWLSNYPRPLPNFSEPFAGGGIAALTAAFEGLARHVTMVEIDEQVAAVWNVIIYGDAQALADRIMSFKISIENVNNTLADSASSVDDMAFRTILKNRTFHGGILAPGSALIKNGENGKGILSRWYPATLCKRILAINQIRDRISFIQGDGLEYLKNHQSDEGAAFFIDPPYTASKKKAGARLYSYFQLNHEELFSIVRQLRGDFLITYDDDRYIEQLALSNGLKYHPVSMKNTHHHTLTELLISRDLSWTLRAT